MQRELTEVLTNILIHSVGILNKRDFLMSILSEIHSYLKGHQSRFFVKNRYNNNWMQISCPAEDVWLQTSLKALCPQDLDTSKQVMRKDKQTLLTLVMEKCPDVILSVSWDFTHPPAWIYNQDLLRAFREVLETYLNKGLIITDIAEAKKSLEQIFDHLPLPISVLTKDYVIERVNHAFINLLGVSFDQTVGKKCFELVHGSVLPDEHCQLQKAILHGKRPRCKTSAKGKKVRITFLPLANPDEHKVLEIYETPDHDYSLRKPWANPSKTNWYNRLSQPLTSLSLLIEIMLLDPEKNVSVTRLKIVQEEIKRMITVLHSEFLEAGVGDKISSSSTSPV